MRCGLCENVNWKYDVGSDVRFCSSMPAGGIELGCSDVTGSICHFQTSVSLQGVSQDLRFVNPFFTLCNRISRPRQSKREI